MARWKEVKDKDPIEALFEPDIYKFGDYEVDQEVVEDYDIIYYISLYLNGVLHCVIHSVHV